MALSLIHISKRFSIWCRWENKKHKKRSPKRASFFVFSADKHGIAKAEEPVFFLHGLAIGIENVFPTGQSGNQHHQSALRQMEIGDEGVQAFEGIAGIDAVSYTHLM